MNGRRGALCGAALAAVLLLAPPGPAAGRAKEDCRTRGTTIEANAHARLFSTFDRRTRARKYYACRLKPRRSVYVGRRDFDDGVRSTLDLSGFHVLYESATCPRDSGCSVEVLLKDVRAPLQTRVVAHLHAPVSPATDLALADDLTAAWIRPAGEFHQVVRDRPVETETVLASGPGVEPGSLATIRNRFYWTNEGRAETARTR